LSSNLPKSILAFFKAEVRTQQGVSMANFCRESVFARRSFLRFILAGFLFLSTNALGLSALGKIQIPLNQSELLTQKVTSQLKMLANFSPSGTSPGIVVASPSREYPNYFFHWIRDGAICFDQALQIYRENPDYQLRAKLRSFFFDHMALNRRAQNDTNALTGLGEPKFNVDGNPNSDPWGRPQNDGPAMRALNFISLYNMIISENWPEKDQLVPILYDGRLPSDSLIKKDLEYVAHHWRESNFDLWEEVQGFHFFTLMVQRKALLLGAALATTLHDPGAAFFYRSEALKMTAEIEKFWNPGSGYIIATRYPSGANARRESRLDSAVILGSILGDAGDGFMAPYDDRILATLQKLSDAFKSLYHINRNTELGVALGRYPEDTYDGYNTNSSGNAWFISTQTGAEIYYRTYLHAKDISAIEINDMNLPFYRSLLGEASILKTGMKFKPSDSLYGKIMSQLLIEGDKMLGRTFYHRDEHGSLSEQMNRFSGYMQGARDLTWSHASFLSAIYWRQLTQ
jgi:glucoamylase